MTGSPTRLSVVMPIYQAAATLGTCAGALVAAARDGDELIVADDGSTDGSLDALDDVVRRRLLVVRSEENIGRGPIRNLGAAAASGDVLVFVDADVAVHPDALDAIRAAFDEHPARASLIGAYDDRPAAPGLVSQYRNLLHHHTHHTHGERATHFWTGLGAVRRDVYLQLGGLDEGTWARDMEDVEFGHRLVDAGHTVDVLPHIQGTHLKQFTLRSMLSTDLLHRAIPWSTLMLQDHLRTDAFVTSWEQKASAASASLLVLAALLAVVAAVAGSSSLVAALLGVAVTALVVFVAVNLPLWRFLAGAKTVGFAVASVPFHVLHALASATGFGIALVRHIARRAARVLSRRDRRAAAAAGAPPP